MAVYKASCKVKDTKSGRTIQANCVLEQRGRATDWKLTVCFHGVGIRATLEHLYHDTVLEDVKIAAPDSVREMAAMYFVLNCRKDDIQMSELVW